MEATLSYEHDSTPSSNECDTDRVLRRISELEHLLNQLRESTEGSSNAVQSVLDKELGDCREELARLLHVAPCSDPGSLAANAHHIPGAHSEELRRRRRDASRHFIRRIRALVRLRARNLHRPRPRGSSLPAGPPQRSWTCPTVRKRSVWKRRCPFTMSSPTSCSPWVEKPSVFTG